MNVSIVSVSVTPVISEIIPGKPLEVAKTYAGKDAKGGEAKDRTATRAG